MFPNRFHTFVAALALIAGPAALCQAQYEDHCGPFCEGCSDLRYFEPVDLDLDCMPVDRDCGYTFSYDKLYWAFTGDRTTIGAPGLTDISEVFIQNFGDPTTGLPVNPQPQPYTIINGIQDAPPYAGFGWGDRYELGYFKDNIAYSIGILSGPSISSSEHYGFLPLNLGNEGVDIDGDGVIDDNQGTGVIGPPPPSQDSNPTPLEILLAPTLNGFGSVHVNFNVPNADFMLGFRNQMTNLFDGAFNFELDNGLEGGFIVIGPDGDLTLVDNLIDDLNGNAATIFVVLAPVDPADPGGDQFIVSYIYDVGDLHRFNFRFNTLQVRSRTETDGIELMKTHRLNNRHRMAKNQNGYIEFGYGVRYFRMTDNFRFDGITDVAGRIFTITDSENSIVGPQIRIKAGRQVGKWNTSVDTRFMFGYNIQNVDQTNGFGDDALPAGVNNLLFLQPTYSRYGARADDFTPFIEFRAETKYQVTRSLALKAGFTATYVDRLTRSSQVVLYNAPDFGIGQAGEQDIFISGLNFGAEFVH